MSTNEVTFFGGAPRHECVSCAKRRDLEAEVKVGVMLQELGFELLDAKAAVTCDPRWGIQNCTRYCTEYCIRHFPRCPELVCAPSPVLHARTAALYASTIPLALHPRTPQHRTWSTRRWPHRLGLQHGVVGPMSAAAIITIGCNMCRAVPCRTILCRAVPCCAVPCRTILSRAVSCCAMLCRAVPCRVVPCLVVARWIAHGLNIEA